MAVRMGHLEIVRFFIQELKWNINQQDSDDMTPLCLALGFRFDEQRPSLEIAHFLLENGANVNLGGQYFPLLNSVNANMTEVTRLLLFEYQANPNLNQRPPDDKDNSNVWDWDRNDRCTDLAIIHGNAEILRMLLECGAWVGYSIDQRNGASLNFLLYDEYKSIETKLTISRILIEHAKKDHATAACLRVSFEFESETIFRYDNSWILLDAGFDPRIAMFCVIRANNLSYCQLLVNVYHADPFLQDKNEDDDDSDNLETAVSPFLAAARQSHTRIFEYFLGLWNDRFASAGGKNNDGDYPIHVVCCDPHVSIQAIQLLVNHHPDALAVVDGEQGLLPLHFAANWGASLDVIFFLLQHCPDALCHCGNAVTGVPHRHPSPPTVEETSMSMTTTTTTTTTSETVDSNNDDSRHKKKARRNR